MHKVVSTLKAIMILPGQNDVNITEKKESYPSEKYESSKLSAGTIDINNDLNKDISLSIVDTIPVEIDNYKREWYGIWNY